MIDPAIRSNFPQVELRRVFPDSSIVTLTPGTDRCGAIKQLVESIVVAGRLPIGGRESILASLIERERFAPSGLWRGFALPHLRTRFVEEVTGAVGIAADEIDFGAMDGVPTKTVFLVLSPFDSRVLHLQVLGQLAAIIQDPTLGAVFRSATTVGEISRLWHT